MKLPWSEVNAQPGFEVAKLLEPHGLVPARRERYKWACPTSECTSSDGFHTYPKGGRRSRCFVCDVRLSNVDLAALVRAENPRDACRWLAGQFGLHVESWNAPPVRSSFTVSSPKPNRAATASRPEGPTAEVVHFDSATLYADLLARTSLTGRGAAYLKGRGIPPAFAREYGFRSIDGPAGWAALRRHLGSTYSRDAIRAAGFAGDGRNRVWTPFGGLVPMLLIPFRHGCRTEFVRMRTIGPPPGRLIEVVPDWFEKWNRYRAPRDVLPRLPFNADALSRRIVHLVEGELNALTLILPSYGLDSIGLPGAGVLDPEWVRLLASAELVVTWYDSDPAGQLARSRADAAFAAAHGNLWVERRLYHMELPPGRDANALHIEGTLARMVRSALWLTRLSRN